MIIAADVKIISYSRFCFPASLRLRALLDKQKQGDISDFEMADTREPFIKNASIKALPFKKRVQGENDLKKSGTTSR